MCWSCVLVRAPPCVFEQCSVIRKTGQGVRAQHSTEHKRKNKEETGRRTAKTPGEHQLPAGVLNPPRTPGTSPTSKA